MEHHMADQDSIYGVCKYKKKSNYTLYLKVTFAFMFLTISTCWNPWLIPDSGWKWWIAYRSGFSLER